MSWIPSIEKKDGEPAIGWNVGKRDHERWHHHTPTGRVMLLCLEGKIVDVLRSAVYWWTEEITDLQRRCLELRRKATRLRRRNPELAERESKEYKSAKKKN